MSTYRVNFGSTPIIELPHSIAVSYFQRHLRTSGYRLTPLSRVGPFSVPNQTFGLRPQSAVLHRSLAGTDCWNSATGCFPFLKPLDCRVASLLAMTAPFPMAA
jgi:hypothetical protein